MLTIIHTYIYFLKNKNHLDFHYVSMYIFSCGFLSVSILLVSWWLTYVDYTCYTVCYSNISTVVMNGSKIGLC